jgi:hypothetical protein
MDFWWFLFLFFGSATPCASPPPWPSLFPIILFLSTTLLTGMTCISLHMQWPLTSQSHGSLLKENNCFCHRSNTTHTSVFLYKNCHYRIYLVREHFGIEFINLLEQFYLSLPFVWLLAFNAHGK